MEFFYAKNLLINESSLRTANFHKKSYFEGYFNFLKFSDALASVN
jgi:hypothetical protein